MRNQRCSVYIFWDAHRRYRIFSAWVLIAAENLRCGLAVDVDVIPLEYFTFDEESIAASTGSSFDSAQQFTLIDTRCLGKQQAKDSL